MQHCCNRVDDSSNERRGVNSSLFMKLATVQVTTLHNLADILVNTIVGIRFCNDLLKFL